MNRKKTSARKDGSETGKVIPLPVAAKVMYNGQFIPASSVRGGPPPKVGEDIYLNTALYLSHGRDDFEGGLCRVTKVTVETSSGQPAWFVETEERPGYSTNWEYLREQQAKLKAQFGSRRGHPDPDNDPSANEW